MLAVTESAGLAITTLTASKRKQDTPGLRIAVATVTENSAGPSLRASLAARPEAEDAVVTCGSGAQVFLAPQAAGYLANKVLDAHKDIDGRFHFALHPQH